MLLRSAVQHADLSTLRVTLRVTVDRSKDGGREENLTLNDSKERLKINVWLASYLYNPALQLNGPTMCLLRFRLRPLRLMFYFLVLNLQWIVHRIITIQLFCKCFSESYQLQ